MKFSPTHLLMLTCLIAVAAPALAVDGVLEINNARAEAGGVTPGDTPGYPVTIDQSGSYRLTGDLYVSGTSTNVVEITTDHVTLDLNGFSIRCLWVFTPCAGGGTGRGIDADAADKVTLRNGTIREMAGDGIWLGDQGRIENLQVVDNGAYGIRAGMRSSVIGTTAINNGFGGIFLDRHSRISGSTATDNGRSGIRTTGYGSIIDNTASQNSMHGIDAGNSAIVRGNMVFENGDDGINAPGGLIQGNQAVSNGGAGIKMINDGLATGNRAYGNDGFGLDMNLSGFSGNLMSYNQELLNSGDEITGGIPMGVNLCSGSACP